jgi:hypothetical protein
MDSKGNQPLNADRCHVRRGQARWGTSGSYLTPDSNDFPRIRND